MAGGFPDWINLGCEMINAASDFLFGFRMDGDEIAEKNVISAGDDLVDGITVHYGAGVIFGIGFGFEGIGADLDGNVHHCLHPSDHPPEVEAGCARRRRAAPVDGPRQLTGELKDR
jgi:hypothetical protein